MFSRLHCGAEQDAPRWLGHLRRVVVLNRDGYTCCYCHRTAWDVFAESGRTLRLELDHQTAKARLPNCDDFDLVNLAGL